MSRLLVFDLDGTLIDSAGGIARSVNRTRQYFNFPELDEKLISSFVGNGAKILLERATQDIHLPVPLDEAVKIMVQFYAADPLFHTFCYPGVIEGLQQLKAAGYTLCIVSNKPQIVADKIISGLNMDAFLADNIGGNNGFPLKPAPDAINFLRQKHHAATHETLVIGDNYTDLAAAENAGVNAVFCRYGLGDKMKYPAIKEVDDFYGLTRYLTTGD